MPIYPFKCKVCDSYQELWLDQPMESVVGGECTNGEPCTMVRVWTPVNLGPVPGAGFSPARNSKRPRR